jgi:hypothetical protein
MRKNLTAMWLCCVVLFLVSGATVIAQTTTASVRGTVTDPSGAVVAGANVTATNVDTGVATNTVTNKSGLYNFQYLTLGNYTITASASGFNTASVGPFHLQIDQIAKIDAQLTVGTASTTVKVASDAGAILNTENATLGTSISANTLQNMPLPALNVNYATMFVPGALNPTVTDMGGLQGSYRTTTANGVPSFNGNRQQGNNFVLDGIEVNETIANLPGYNPSPYSLQEIRIITGNSDAEYGNVAGAEVLMVTKAGTNKFHGNAFEYFKNQNFAAAGWANNYSRTKKVKFNQHQFGGSLGGPILKNKLFFFGDYEGMRYNIPTSQQSVSVPDAFERTGDFHELASVEHIQLYDTTHGTDNATPYPNNQLPGVYNPVAQYLFAHPNVLPLPNRAPNAGFVTQGNYVGLQSSQNINSQGDGRVDYTLSNHDTLMLKGTYDDAHDQQNQVPLPIIFPLTDSYPFYMGVIDWIHTFSPSLVNEVRVGYSRVVEDTETTDPTKVFGKSGNNLVGIPFTGQSIPGFSQIAIGGSDNSAFGTNPAAGTKTVDNNFDYGDDVTWVHGKHITRMGAQFVRYQENYVAPSNLGGILGTFAYYGVYTTGGDSPGDGYADFELDDSQVANLSGVTGPFGARQWRDAVYIQDDWKVLPNVTVNLGLRYAYDQPMYEAHDKMVSVDLPKARFAPVGTDPATLLKFAGKNGNSRALVNPFWGQVMPRVGFAWQFTPRTVIRGGYSITDESEGTGSGLRMTQNPPFNVSFTQVDSGPTATTGGNPLRAGNGFKSATPVPGSGSQYDVWDPNFRPATVQQYNLTMQFLLARKTSAQVGYVGQYGTHLAVPVLLNQYIAPVPATCPPSDTTGCVDLVAPYYSLVGGQSQIVETASRARSNYNALQATLHQQETDGLEFTLNYTWARSLTNNPGGFFGVGGVLASDFFWQNAYDPSADYGPSSFDVPQNFNATVVYQLPFGHEKKFGANWNRFTDEIAGGWEISANVLVGMGFPFNIYQNPNDNLNTAADSFNYNGYARVNKYFPLKKVHQSIKNWFGTDPSATPCKVAGSRINALGVPCAYGISAPNQFGTAQNGTERAPGSRNVDLSVYKAFRTYKEQTMQVRIDAFNAFNNVNFGAPSARIGRANFGQITNVLNAGRQVQLSGVYTF